MPSPSITASRCLALVIAGAVLVAAPGCVDREAEARRQLNTAIAEWDAGRLEESMRLLDAVIASHGETRSATDALQYKRDQLAAYREQWDAGGKSRVGNGDLVRLVEARVVAFRQAGNAYPATLDEIDWSSVPESPSSPGVELLKTCRYDPALFDVGFRLDCTAASRDWMAQLAEQRAAAVAAQRAQRQRGSDPAAIALSADSPSLVPAKVTWGKHFLPSSGAPIGAFHAVYFNTREPTRPIAVDRVDKVSINYAWDELEGIKSEDFGAYWAGTLRFAEPVTKRIALSQSWSKTRVIIDGKIAYEGGDDREFRYRFEAGDHLFEVEYINNWHTTDFNLTFVDDADATVEIATLRQSLASVGNAKLLLAAVYESAARDHAIDVDLQPSEGPVVLILSSYSPVRWNLRNPHQVELRAVAFGSHSPGSELAGDVPETAQRLRLRGQLGQYATLPTCSCAGASYHCDGGSIFSTQRTLLAITGLPLHGFSGAYGASSMQVPELLLTPTALAPLQEKQAAMDKQRDECRQQNAPDFETLIDGD